MNLRKQTNTNAEWNSKQIFRVIFNYNVSNFVYCINGTLHRDRKMFCWIFSVECIATNWVSINIYRLTRRNHGIIFQISVRGKCYWRREIRMVGKSEKSVTFNNRLQNICIFAAFFATNVKRQDYHANVKVRFPFYRDILVPV